MKMNLETAVKDNIAELFTLTLYKSFFNGVEIIKIKKY